MTEPRRSESPAEPTADWDAGSDPSHAPGAPFVAPAAEPPTRTARRLVRQRRSAVAFVVLLGVVSLFADMTYEGARSITGPYLAVLGASATVVGVVAGLGELLGYALRLVSGYLSDRTRRHWTIVFAGYALNLLAVPLLALAGRWELAAVLMLLERAGKAIRTPSRDAMLSHATSETGHGWGFGLHEAMDQIGAMLGPLIVAAVLASHGYRQSFALLLLPALAALATLTAARVLYPRPHELEIRTPELETRGFTRAFWLYLTAAALVAAGYADFPLIAYHFQRTETVAPAWVPIFYAIAMGIDALAALLFGRLFDRTGLAVLAAAALLSALFAPLVFLGSFGLALAGVALWGIGMGAQESIMRAAIARLAPRDRRGTAYGVFNTGFGVFWFIGSVVMGALYDHSIPVLIGFSVLLQLAAAPLFLLVQRWLAARPPAAS